MWSKKFGFIRVWKTLAFIRSCFLTLTLTLRFSPSVPIILPASPWRLAALVTLGCGPHWDVGWYTCTHSNTAVLVSPATGDHEHLTEDDATHTSEDPLSSTTWAERTALLLVHRRDMHCTAGWSYWFCTRPKPLNYATFIDVWLVSLLIWC